MVKINEAMKEDICLDLERGRPSRLKLSKNKSLESVNSGDLVMIRRTSKHDPPQFGLVISLENQGRDGTVQLKSGYRLVTSVGNLVPIGSGTVEGRLANGEDNSADQSIMSHPRVGMELTHFISLSLGNQEEQLKGIEKFQKCR